MPSLFLGPRCTRGPRVRLWVGGLEPDCLAPCPKLEAQGPRRQCRPGWARLRRRLRSLTGKERESGLLSALRDGPPSWDPCRCLSFPQPGVCYFLTVHVRPWRLILEPPGSQGKGGARPAPGGRPLEAQARDWAEQETVLAGGGRAAATSVRWFTREPPGGVGSAPPRRRRVLGSFAPDTVPGASTY